MLIRTETDVAISVSLSY